MSEENVYDLHSTGAQTPIIYGKFFGWRAMSIDTKTGHMSSPIRMRGFLTGSTFHAKCDAGNWSIVRPWPPLAQSSKLKHTPNHQEAAPQIYCSCGLHAYATLAVFLRNKHMYQPTPHLLAMGSSPAATVLVSASGKVILHEQGFRAQTLTVEKIFSNFFDAKLKRRFHSLYPDVGIHEGNAFRYMKLPQKYGKVTLQATPRDEFDPEDISRWTNPIKKEEK